MVLRGKSPYGTGHGTDVPFLFGYIHNEVRYSFTSSIILPNLIFDQNYRSERFFTTILFEHFLRKLDGKKGLKIP